MFAEEVKGNAAKKRQEEARARRRNLKHQQEKEAKEAAAAKDASDISLVSAPSASQQISPATQVITTSKPEALNPDSAVVAGKSSSVAAALHQRQVRHDHQLRAKSSLIIQSFYRSYRSNLALLKNHAHLLSLRLKDVATLRVLLKQKTSAEYIVPPATVSVLVRQLLFLSRSLPYHNGKPSMIVLRSPDDQNLLQQIIQYAILPGIMGSDPNLDPILAWAGHRRLKELLRLTLVVAVTKNVEDHVLRTIDTFIRTVTCESSGARQVVIKESQQILFSISSDAPTTKPVTKLTIPHCVIGSSLDFIAIARHHLMFCKGDPIPAEATKRREAFFASNRHQNDILFLMVLDIVSSGLNRRLLLTRFLAEVMTIPLLSWKISSASFIKLIDGTPRPVFLEIIRAFTEQHSATLTAGEIASVLPTVDVPLTSCPATNTQCLMANLVQVGRLCPSINGNDSVKIDYQDGSLFFNFMATLVDALPLGTFSTARESAVEWISDGGHHTPVVLSPIVLEQCKLFLVDSYVRCLFLSAINGDTLGTERILKTKNDKDLKQERDLTSTDTAASLAAKEARVDRSKGFWKSSKWAKNLTTGVSKMLSGDDGKLAMPKATRKNGPGMLVNTSSVSRKLANGEGAHDRSVVNAMISSSEQRTKVAAATKHYDPDFLFALCRSYGTILARWGGGGLDDVVCRKNSEVGSPYKESFDKQARATLRSDACTMSILNSICFSTSIVQTTWALTQSNTDIITELYAVVDSSKRSTPIRSLNIRPKWGAGNKQSNGAVQLLFFNYCFAHTLIITDDVEILDMDKPLPIHQVRRCIQLLKRLLYRACCVDDTRVIGQESDYFGLSLISASARTMRDLYDRSSRRPLCVPKLWIVDDLLDNEIKRAKTFQEYESLLSLPVLRVCPFLVSFKRRLKLFERIVATNKIDMQGQHNNNPFSNEPGLKPGIPVRIMRGRVLEDGIATMNNLGKNMRQRIVVYYMNEAGAAESGVDVGGLFKEFWTDLSAIAFNPNYALFRVTEGGTNCMYPNPSSGAAHGTQHRTLFEFLGRILGKALYEGITIHPQFAHFFLSFLRGEYNFLHMFSDLGTMDAQLYNNLMFLKTYDGDAEDLCLTFTVANDDFGGNREVNLIPNGSDVCVTNLNKQRYIGLVAKYHVCDRVKEQSEAFTRGLWEVIDRSWLRIFNEPELQILISGPVDGGIDVADMKANTRYIGGFSGLDPTVSRFWSVVASLTSEQQSRLLRFVTSCERPPPLGFASMNPPFTIQRVGILRDGDRLPTASTCFNTLKLPTYSSEKILKQRLVYAIESCAGFELS